VLSFATLFLGKEEAALDATLDALAEYMNSGEPLAMDEMPLLLWDCVVERVARDSPAIECQTLSSFDHAVMNLDPAERLVFLLRTVFDVPVGWIMLITKWPEERVISLSTSATARMRASLSHIGELERLKFLESQASKLSIDVKSRDADEIQLPRRDTIN
jgi:DNA-directed RNA polymerase specialized sigma24 family protein